LDGELTCGPAIAYRLKFWIQVELELDANIEVVKYHSILDGSVIAVTFPDGGLRVYDVPVRNTPVQAVPLENAEFDLGHFQPTPASGCAVDFEPPPGAPPCPWGSKV
jgi:hypothetical protein